MFAQTAAPEKPPLFNRMSILGRSLKQRTFSMPSIAAYFGAAIAEIAGCFAFWAWLRLDKSVW